MMPAAASGFDFNRKRCHGHEGIEGKTAEPGVVRPGQDLVEYALLASLIAAVAFASVVQVGNTIDTVFWKAISSANV
jgi:Flp pilus assembly pilin Flp